MKCGQKNLTKDRKHQKQQKLYKSDNNKNCYYFGHIALLYRQIATATTQSLWLQYHWPCVVKTLAVFKHFFLHITASFSIASMFSVVEIHFIFFMASYQVLYKSIQDYLLTNEPLLTAQQLLTLLSKPLYIIQFCNDDNNHMKLIKVYVKKNPTSHKKIPYAVSKSNSCTNQQSY